MNGRGGVELDGWRGVEWTSEEVWEWRVEAEPEWVKGGGFLILQQQPRRNGLGPGFFPVYLRPTSSGAFLFFYWFLFLRIFPVSL